MAVCCFRRRDALRPTAWSSLMLGVGVSPAPPLYPLGPSFLVRLSAGGSSILAETDVDRSQFDAVSEDGEGNLYIFGHGTGRLPAAAFPPVLAAPCSSEGGAFVVQVSAAGAVSAATYLRQGSGRLAAIRAPGQLSVYRDVSQTMAPVDLAAIPGMNFGCLQNLASGEVGPGISQGEIFAIFGHDLGPAQAMAGAPGASGRYPTSLAGVRVLINGTAAPLLMVQAGEIHGVVPFGYSPGIATVEVQNLGQAAPDLDAPTSVNPGIFAIDGQGAIVNQDGTVNSRANPARAGSWPTSPERCGRILSAFFPATGSLWSFLLTT